jgi:hypothetical protein
MGCSLLSIVEIFYFMTSSIMEGIRSMRVKKSSQFWAMKSFELKPGSTLEDLLRAHNALTKIVLEYNAKLDEILKHLAEPDMKLGNRK